MALRRDIERDWQDPDPPVDDADLVAAARGDRAAFAALYRRYLDPVYRYCSRQFDLDTAGDVTSTIFLKVMAALDSYDPERAGFRSWLFTIAHHAVVDQKRMRVHGALDDIDPFDGDPTPEEMAIQTDRIQRLSVALRRLPVDQQAVINLRLAGLTGPEIATVLNKRSGTVRVLQHRAIQTLNSMLGEDPGSHV